MLHLLGHPIRQSLPGGKANVKLEFITKETCI